MQYQVASHQPHSQAAFRSPAGGIFSLWRKAPAAFPLFSWSHWAQRDLRISLLFSNRVSFMIAGVLELRGYAAPVCVLAARAFMNWSFWDCRLLNPRTAITSSSEHSQCSATHSMQYQVASQAPRSQAALRNSAAGMPRVCQKVPTAFPLYQFRHSSQRIARWDLPF